MKVIDIVFTNNPDADQAKVKLAINRIESLVKEYCNRSDIPSALTFLIADMVMDYLNLSNRNENPESYVTAKSVKEGDVTVELTNSSLSQSEASLQQLLTDYKSQLNKHRKLRW